MRAPAKHPRDAVGASRRRAQMDRPSAWRRSVRSLVAASHEDRCSVGRHQIPRPTGSAVVATRLTSRRAPIFVIRVMTSSTSAISASAAIANPVPSVRAPSSWVTIVAAIVAKVEKIECGTSPMIDAADHRDRDRLAEGSAEAEHRSADRRRRGPTGTSRP